MMWERWLGVLGKVFNAPPLYLSYLNLFLGLKYYYLGIGSQRGSFEEGQLLPSLKAPPLHIALSYVSRSSLSLADGSLLLPFLI